MNKLLVAGAIASAMAMVGCSNTSTLTEIQSLTDRVDALSSEVSVLRSEQSASASDVNDAQVTADRALAEATRANERLDNMASSSFIK